MNKIESILYEIRKDTDTVILFSSITGKDSILLKHYCSQIFKRVICVYMYMIKDFTFIKKYQRYFETRYSNLEFMQIPHYVLSNIIKNGLYGVKKEKQKQYTLYELNELVRENIGIQWTIYGMKQNDSLNRRLQLQKYEHAIYRKTKKCYPLSEFSNKQVLSLIELNNLPKPISYNKDLSSGDDISDPQYLMWLYENYPSDLEKVFTQFPGTKITFYEQAQKVESI